MKHGKTPQHEEPEATAKLRRQPGKGQYTYKPVCRQIVRWAFLLVQDVLAIRKQLTGGTNG
jgi:hypothetical protein